MKIAAIYLAGGHSKRMKIKGSKLALPVGKMTLGSVALETILQSTIETVFVVVQENAAISWLPKTMRKHPKCNIVTCKNASIGQAETLRCGIQIAAKLDMDAVIIFLADQPFITLQMIDQMIQCFYTKPKSKFIATTNENMISPPVLFRKELFPKLLNLQGDIGAKAILKGDFLTLGTMLPCKDARLVADIDTKEDYEEYFN